MSDELGDNIYNEEKFLLYKKEMENDWMKDPINKAELDKNLSNYFNNLHEEYSQNCLLIGLLQFQCQCEKINSSFIVPFYSSRKFDNIDFIINNFKSPKKIDKFINFFEKNKSPLINYYFWNITFPNIFGSFFSQEFCESAFNFLTKFQDNADIFSKGVISFINHNYLFQNSFLNTFYTLINRSCQNKDDTETKIYRWCQYDQEQYENIIQTALIEALQTLNSHQITALNLLIDKYQQNAMDLIFTDIIIYNLKNIWPYSTFFLPNEMIANIEEKYINNPNSYKNRKNLLEKCFSEAKKLTIKSDFKISDLVSEKESFIVTNLDLILIYSILDEKISTNYPNLIEDSQIIQQKNDNLITFMLSRCFKYHKIEIYFDHKIQPKSYTKIKIPSLINAWENHEEECKLRNENPLAAIFNNQPIDKNVAFYGLYNAYHQRESLKGYKEDLTNKMGFLIPLQKSIEMQNSLIEMSSLRLSKLMDASEFPDSLIFVYINHVKSLIFTFSKETLIRDSQLIPLFETVFQEMFSDKYESELLLHIKDFTFRKDSSSILFNYFMKVYNELKAKFIDSIPNEINLNGKNKQQIVSEHKRRNIKSEISESFSFNFIRKIEFSLAVGCLLNNPQKFQFDSTKKDNLNISALKKVFDELENNSVFSYIESVCYRLFKENKANSNLNVGIVLISVPTILKMISQFFYKNNDDEIIVHPFINQSCRISFDISFLAKCIIKYALLNKKMNVYNEIISEYENEKIDMLAFYAYLIDYAANYIKENKFDELFYSIYKIYDQIEDMKSLL